MLTTGLTGLGSTLSASQIYQVARQAGFPAETAVKMTAIALKESAGNTQAYNGVGPDDSYGLWQINMKGNLGTFRLSQFGLSDKSDLYDPLTNAKAAYAIWAGNDANLNAAWAINRGVDKTRYQAALPTAISAAESVDPAVSQVADDLSQLSSDVQDTTDTTDTTSYAVDSSSVISEPVLFGGALAAGLLLFLALR